VWSKTAVVTRVNFTTLRKMGNVLIFPVTLLEAKLKAVSLFENSYQTGIRQACVCKEREKSQHFLLVYLAYRPRIEHAISRVHSKSVVH
jgi:hypothetical protein